MTVFVPASPFCPDPPVTPGPYLPSRTVWTLNPHLYPGDAGQSLVTGLEEEDELSIFHGPVQQSGRES